MPLMGVSSADVRKPSKGSSTACADATPGSAAKSIESLHRSIDRS